ncbi:MAG: hypothetical protein V3R25_09135 [Nitrosomonadaceae bacterium]
MPRWDQNLIFDKDPSDVIDFIWDFKGLLKSDSISTQTTVGENITIDSSAILNNQVTVFVSGGTAGIKAKVTTKIVTSNATPRTFERSFRLDLKEL